MELQDKGSKIISPKCVLDLQHSVPLPRALGQHFVKLTLVCSRRGQEHLGQEHAFCCVSFSLPVKQG